jgi:glycosyltransferase involved in cell wall biosynthesis
MTNKNIIIIRNASSYDFGGGERFPVFLASTLANFEFTPLVISRSSRLLGLAHDNNIKTIRGWWCPKQNWSGKSILLFPIYVIWQVILTLWYLLIFIINKPSAVHIQSKDDFIAATFAGKIIGAKIIWTDHADLKHIWKNLGVWYKNPVGKLVYMAAKYTDTITLVSESEYKLVNINLFPNSHIKRKMRVIYNGVTDVSSQYKKAYSNDLFYFCSVSRLVFDKGIRELINAFTELSKEYPNLGLRLIGNGPKEKDLKELAKGQANIEFLGYQRDPFNAIVNSDVYVHPTYHEGFSISLVEAGMLERPIIATAIGGNLEIVHDRQDGILIPTKDTGALYDAMELLYTNKELRDNIARKARAQYKNKFQFDRIVKEKFIPLYGIYI